MNVAKQSFRMKYSPEAIEGQCNDKNSKIFSFSAVEITSELFAGKIQVRNEVQGGSN